MEEMDNSDLKEVEMEDLVINTIPDIDGCDLDNPLAVVEYVEDIYTFYRKTEVSIYHSIIKDLLALLI
ncbi:hypothetical protein BHE74_00011899 [Ensete ventricosum]|nr:hypothetical protein BHE74_00011899 [Ensete ventricosum]